VAGTTPSRPRYGVRINGLDALALTKLDVLDALDEISICTAYRCKGRTLTEFPSDVSQLAACEPVYETMPGWATPTKACTRLRAAGAARATSRASEEITGVEMAIVSTGRAGRHDRSRRHQSLQLDGSDSFRCDGHSTAMCGAA
jgi:adenylosuccinate synthase